MTVLPPIDAHAHIETGVPSRNLEALGAAVFAVTRGPDEWAAAAARQDPLALWGLGIHPRLISEHTVDSTQQLAELLPRTLLIGEVGLDGRAPAPMAAQRAVFDEVLHAAQHTPRPVSIHSSNACNEVLEALTARPVRAPILHWWRGSQAQTRDAVALGCFFSINGAQVGARSVVDQLPPDRVLTETDFPHSRRQDSNARRPAAVATIENFLMTRWGLPRDGLRLRLWTTLSAIVDSCALTKVLPSGVTRVLNTLPARGAESPSPAVGEQN